MALRRIFGWTRRLRRQPKNRAGTQVRPAQELERPIKPTRREDKIQRLLAGVDLQLTRLFDHRSADAMQILKILEPMDEELPVSAASRVRELLNGSGRFPKVTDPEIRDALEAHLERLETARSSRK